VVPTVQEDALVTNAVKIKSEIEAMIARIEADDRYNYPPADPFSNYPLALIQVELKGQVAALRWAAGLDKEMATSAKAVSPEVRRAVDKVVASSSLKPRKKRSAS
jgi:hypothetical protein